MATLKVLITAPSPATVVNRSIQITGTVTVENSSNEVVLVSSVRIQFGENGPSFPAMRVGNSWANWKATRNAPAGVIGGDILEIIATAAGQVRPTGHTNEPWEPIDGAASVTVDLEATPPVVTIDPYTPEVTPASLPYRLTLSGSAKDEGAAVKEVRWRLNGGSFAPVDNIQGNWLRWQKDIDLPAGEHLITIQAVDTLENKSFRDAPISVRTPFQPTNAELAFAPVTYLQELMGFAGRWIKVGSTGAGPTPQDLTNRFFQPFDRLTEANLYELATRQLHQTRIAVEVLRRRLRQTNQPVPRAVEQNFRRIAYEALLLQLGTSHEELRAARIAGDANRRAVAERLGFGVESARPDRLDRITLTPDQVTEAQLEKLFGFEASTNDDPLRTMGAAAEILNWRLAAIGDRWTLEDAQTRDGTDGSIPIIDPDLVSEANLLTRAAGNRVHELWKARKTWIAAKLAEAEGQRQQGFEHVVRTFIGSLDFAALTTQDANGVEISPVLDPLSLELSAFRFLAKCWELAGAGALLETEWRDILDIVVQVHKKRQYPQWRVEESGLTLTPQYFRLPDEQHSGPTVSPWRARWPVYAGWRNTLAVRIRQLQDVSDAYRSALDTAEARALPVLRDSLIEIIGRRQTPQKTLQPWPSD